MSKDAHVGDKTRKKQKEGVTVRISRGWGAKGTVGLPVGVGLAKFKFSTSEK